MNIDYKKHWLENNGRRVDVDFDEVVGIYIVIWFGRNNITWVHGSNECADEAWDIVFNKVKDELFQSCQK